MPLDLVCLGSFWIYPQGYPAGYPRWYQDSHRLRPTVM